MVPFGTRPAIRREGPHPYETLKVLTWEHWHSYHGDMIVEKMFGLVCGVHMEL